MRQRTIRLIATTVMLSAGGVGCQTSVHVNPPAASPSAKATHGPSPVRISNAEVSPRAAQYEQENYVPLRSEGSSHALERNRFGVVLMSEANGVEGYLKSPSNNPRANDVLWAGFVEKDAVVLLVGETLYRAESTQDAQHGRVIPLPHRVEPGAKVFASGGGKVVAYAQPSPPRLFVSNDNANTFFERKLADQTPVIDLAVRRDGVIVVAHDLGKKKNSWGHDDQLAQIRRDDVATRQLRDEIERMPGQR